MTSGIIYQSTTGISAGTNKNKDDESNASGRTSGMIYQSTTGISAGTNKRKMGNLMPPAGVAGRD